MAGDPILIIPLVSQPSRFEITLGGKDYRITTYYRDVAEGGWHMSIDDVETDAPLVHGIPLVTGADLLEQYGYLGFGVTLTVLSDKPNEEPANFFELGTKVRLAVNYGVEDA